MISYLVWPAAILTGWALVYAIWIRPLRAKLAAVVPEIVEAPSTRLIVAGGGVVLVPPTGWQKFVAAVEGWKTVGLTFIVSVFASISAAFDALQSAGTLGDLQAVPWASVFKPDIALKVVSALLVIVPVFHMIGKVKAAMAEPVSTGSARAEDLPN